MDALTRLSRISYACAFGATTNLVYEIIINGQGVFSYDGPRVVNSRFPFPPLHSSSLLENESLITADCMLSTGFLSLHHTNHVYRRMRQMTKDCALSAVGFHSLHCKIIFTGNRVFDYYGLHVQNLLPTVAGFLSLCFKIIFTSGTGERGWLRRTVLCQQ